MGQKNPCRPSKMLNFPDYILLLETPQIDEYQLNKLYKRGKPNFIRLPLKQKKKLPGSAKSSCNDSDHCSSLSLFILW